MKSLISLLVVCLVVSWCGSTEATVSEQAIRTHWQTIASHLPPIDHPSVAHHIDRSLDESSYLMLSGSYEWTISHTSGSWSLIAQGVFGMEDEPLQYVWQGSWQLSWSSLEVDFGTGYVSYAARSRHNRHFAWATSFPLPALWHTLINARQMMWYVDFGVFSWEMIAYQTGAQSYHRSLDAFTLSDTQHTTTITPTSWWWQITSHPHYDTHRATECDISADFSQGTCLISPPATDAHQNHRPSRLKRSAELVLER